MPNHPEISFVDPTALLVGKIVLAGLDYIGPYVQVEAGDAFSVRLSAEDNLQDNVRISATTRDVIIGECTSIAHGARVINSRVGKCVFVGFNAVLENAILEDGGMVQHGARVCGVTIPQGRVVPVGAVITSPSQVAELEEVSAAQDEFKEEVVAVNNELAAGYTRLLLEMGESGVRGVAPNPHTSWNITPTWPVLGRGILLAGDARIIGNVQLGGECTVGWNSSIRGDEGTPIVIGAGMQIGNRVTFHALKGQAIRIGERCSSGDRCVFHGELTIGDDVSVGSDVVLFRAIVGSRVNIGKGAIVIGVRLAEGVCVPDGALVLDQSSADQLAGQ